MKCPYLMTLIFSLCRIEGRFYAPSLLELHEYCRTENHARCPLFEKKGQYSAQASTHEKAPESAEREE